MFKSSWMLLAHLFVATMVLGGPPRRATKHADECPPRESMTWNGSEWQCAPSRFDHGMHWEFAPRALRRFVYTPLYIPEMCRLPAVVDWVEVRWDGLPMFGLFQCGVNGVRSESVPAFFSWR